MCCGFAVAVVFRGRVRLLLFSFYSKRAGRWGHCMFAIAIIDKTECSVHAIV